MTKKPGNLPGFFFAYTTGLQIVVTTVRPFIKHITRCSNVTLSIKTEFTKDGIKLT